MKVALIGASGNIGSQILSELRARGHEVTAIARNPEKISAGARVKPVRADVGDVDALASALRDHDAVISSVRFRNFDPLALLTAIKASGVKRLIMVGGAGSLEAKSEVQLVEIPEFPAAAKPEALAGRNALNLLRAEAALDWTFLSPSAVIAPGERTGKFRLGKDEVLIGPDGRAAYQSRTTRLRWWTNSSTRGTSANVSRSGTRVGDPQARS
jgi:putative NADH-flavin reductase